MDMPTRELLSSWILPVRRNLEPPIISAICVQMACWAAAKRSNSLGASKSQVGQTCSIQHVQKRMGSYREKKRFISVRKMSGREATDRQVRAFVLERSLGHVEFWSIPHFPMCTSCAAIVATVAALQHSRKVLTNFVVSFFAATLGRGSNNKQQQHMCVPRLLPFSYQRCVGPLLLHSRYHHGAMDDKRKDAQPCCSNLACFNAPHDQTKATNCFAYNMFIFTLGMQYLIRRPHGQVVQGTGYERLS